MPHHTDLAVCLSHLHSYVFHLHTSTSKDPLHVHVLLLAPARNYDSRCLSHFSSGARLAFPTLEALKDVEKLIYIDTDMLVVEGALIQ